MQKDFPLVSVIMPCYKESLPIIKEAVFSILNQSYRRIEFIVVVDNPEAVGTIEFLREISGDDGRIKLLINEKNSGIVKSLNRALACATGDYIARMDADDVSLSDRLENQLRYLEANGLDLVGGYYQEISVDGEVIKIVKNPLTPKGVAKTLEWRSCVGHPTFFVKKNVYDDLGGYDDIPTCEDYHFLLKARAAKYKLGNIPKVCLLYRLTPNSIGRKNHGKQKAITKFLILNYDNPTKITKGDIDNYLKTNQAVKYMNDVNTFYECLDKVRNHSKFPYAFKLLFNRFLYTIVYSKMKDCLYKKLDW